MHSFNLKGEITFQIFFNLCFIMVISCLSDNLKVKLKEAIVPLPCWLVWVPLQKALQGNFLTIWEGHYTNA